MDKSQDSDEWRKPDKKKKRLLLIVMMFSHICVKAYLIVQFKYMQFMVCELYFNKAA